MKITNFKLEETKGKNFLDKEYIASVDVETGVLFWKKVERKQIRRTYARYWHFIDTGEFTPDYQVEELARLWTARTGEET